jgi:hypothetical protein
MPLFTTNILWNVIVTHTVTCCYFLIDGKSQEKPRPTADRYSPFRRTCSMLTMAKLELSVKGSNHQPQSVPFTTMQLAGRARQLQLSPQPSSLVPGNFQGSQFVRSNKCYIAQLNRTSCTTPPPGVPSENGDVTCNVACREVECRGSTCQRTVASRARCLSASASCCRPSITRCCSLPISSYTPAAISATLAACPPVPPHPCTATVDAAAAAADDDDDDDDHYGFTQRKYPAPPVSFCRELMTSPAYLTRAQAASSPYSLFYTADGMALIMVEFHGCEHEQGLEQGLTTPIHVQC